MILWEFSTYNLKNIIKFRQCRTHLMHLLQLLGVFLGENTIRSKHIFKNISKYEKNKLLTIFSEALTCILNDRSNFD